MRYEETTTDWVINIYTNKINEKVNLEPAKNFVFIWSLFEYMSKRNIFSSMYLRYSEFKAWADSLIFKNNRGKITLQNPKNGKEINKRLIDNIDKAFNHFFQRYNNDKNEFISILYNQNLRQVDEEKNKFINFINEMDKHKIQDKIIFLFFVVKRMRNKFFHGIKEIDQVSKDYKEFECSNKYLISIIELIGNYD